MTKPVAIALSKKDTSIKFTLSVSKAKTFDLCKAKYKFCYIDKLPRIDRDFHIFGSFLHEVLEIFHRKILEDPSLIDNWEGLLDESFQEAYEKFSDQITGDQYKDAKCIINEYKELLNDKGIPNVIDVEKPFYIKINDDVLLNGFIDRIQVDSDGIIHVADYKTTKKKKYLNDYFQLLTYCYALMLEDESIKKIRASFILLRHGFEYMTKEYTRDEVMSVPEKFWDYYSKIEDEKLWRPNPQFLCKFCDYQDNCSAGRKFLVKKGIIKEKVVVGIRKW